MEKQTTPTVHIIDDDDEVLQALRWLIESIHVQVETFSSAKDFLKTYKPNMQGCLITDVYMPEMSGLELQDKLVNSDSCLAIIVISGHGDAPMAVRAMKSGAVDFIVKPFNDQQLLERVQDALTTSAKQYERMQREKDFCRQLEKLTSREKQVMNLVANGTKNKLIAQELDISIKTVELHKHNMMNRMQMTSVADLVRKLVTLEPPS